MKFECKMYVRPDLLEIGTLRRRPGLRQPIVNGARFEQVALPGQVSAKFWHLVNVLELVVAQPG